jgi:hypothetical protein
VRQRLSKSMYQGNNPNVPHNERPKSNTEDEKHPYTLVEEHGEVKTEKAASTASVHPKDQKTIKIHKKKSKLCSLL